MNHNWFWQIDCTDLHLYNHILYYLEDSLAEHFMFCQHFLSPNVIELLTLYSHGFSFEGTRFVSSSKFWLLIVTCGILIFLLTLEIDDFHERIHMVQSLANEYVYDDILSTYCMLNRTRIVYSMPLLRLYLFFLYNCRADYHFW